jgi:1-deoxy-D-xylulose-5-phosphate reductoisomerase
MCWGAQAACLHPAGCQPAERSQRIAGKQLFAASCRERQAGSLCSHMKRKRVVVLGATGSIGESAAKVARDIPERVEIVGIAANSKARELAAQANELRPSAVCIVDETKVDELRANLKYQPEIFSGETGLREIASAVASDMVLVAIVGTGGLRPALAAIEAGKDLAVASKEILVMAGEIVMREARERGVHVLPVDSEHNAIFQCLEGRVQSSGFRVQQDERGVGAEPETRNLKPETLTDIRRIILTASGGPFRETPAEKFSGITVEQALKHPTWNMGQKITIDSATLFNKGLEMIEAHWLFGVGMAQVEVVIHPQSIVHSMVEFADGSVLAQLSHSNMCFPIQYAITWPDRVPNSLPPLDFGKLAELKFARPRYEDFPALGLARRAGETGGTLPAVLNAANEIAVSAFLEKRMSFPRIWQAVEQVMDAHESIAHPDLDEILRADQWARAEAGKYVKKLNR